MRRLFYEDFYIREFEATVTSCSDLNGKYSVELSATAFYPEGGGQPCDYGKIGEAVVSDVAEKGGHIFHTTDKPLKVGENYACQIDWNRRYGFMQHHTAEHVISGIIKLHFGADNVGFHLGDDYVTMDYNRRLSGEEAALVEHLANKAVYECKPVTATVIKNPDEMEYRSKKEISGDIRIIDAGGYDLCACCGTHTKNTGELGLIKIISNQSYKGGCRLLMICADKALADYSLKHSNVMEISAKLSAKPSEINLEVDRLIREKAQLWQDYQALKAKYFELSAENLDYGKPVCVFQEQLTADDLRRFVTIISKRADISAVFSGEDQSGYRYAAFSKGCDVKEFSVNFNAALRGKGGGKDIIQGSVTATRNEIEDFFKNLTAQRTD